MAVAERNQHWVRPEGELRNRRATTRGWRFGPALAQGMTRATQHAGRAGTETRMDAIETLMNEHRVIERVLDGLVAFAEEIERKGTTEKEELGRFVTFVREFADACHHGKEEDILFAAMVEHGVPAERRADRGHAPRARPGARARRHPARARRAGNAVERRRPGRDRRGRARVLRPAARAHPQGGRDPLPDGRAAPAARGDGRPSAEACDRYEQDEAGRRTRGSTRSREELVSRHAPAVHPGAQSQRIGCCG